MTSIIDIRNILDQGLKKWFLKCDALLYAVNLQNGWPGCSLSMCRFEKARKLK